MGTFGILGFRIVIFDDRQCVIGIKTRMCPFSNTNVSSTVFVSDFFPIRISKMARIIKMQPIMHY